MSNRDKLISEYIDNLKDLFGASSDSDLARQLGVDKRTVSAWRSRNSIPERFLKLLTGEASHEAEASLMRLSAIDRQAFALSLFRLTRAQSGVASSGDFRQVWDAFHSSLGFWDIMRSARHDILAEMKKGTSDLQTAMALVMHDDIANAQNRIDRDRAMLKKIADRPAG